ncbi:NifU N-terminal domain-containing protein, partial [Klebsiella variicola]
SPLAQRLFDVPGVSGVYFGHDFISVTKADGVNEWPQVKPAVLGAIMEHFQSGAPVLGEGVAGADEDAGEEFYDAADH